MKGPTPSQRSKSTARAIPIMKTPDKEIAADDVLTAIVIAR
jgi:hypothetical protein